MERFGKEKTLEKLPYTVVGHSHLGKPSLHLTLTGEGILAIAKKVKKGDLVRYETWSDVTEECEKEHHYSRWTLIPQNKNYKGI